ncbi:hypothetical protein EIK77_009134 [Talaromyces pinophilus]|nr:hypothetical protein EIK77_009134 [Talaromyces pinophilus]
MDGDAFSSPPPVPFRAPSRAASHHRRNSSLGAVPLSSAFEPFSPVVDDHDIGSDNAEEPFSTFDPRRFTPTLHANLVSEILSLRRELESKNKEIGKLETSLDESQNEYELLNENMTKVTKENRSLKKQMSLLEGGTLSAITEIAKERDEAVENITDVRKRLEQAQKKLKSKEDEVDRSQSLWERDRENWDTERRNWERKVHVVENRLKTILHEVAAAQAAGNLQKLNDADEDATKDNSTTLDSASVRSSSAFDRRPMSASSASTYDGEPLNSGRFSSMSFANANRVNRVKGDGFNLADELALDADEEDYMDLVDEIPEMRPLSVASQSSLNTALKARKILGLSMDASVAVGAREFINLDESTPTTNVTEVKRQPEYRDVGIQFTPPASPLLPASDAELKEPEPEVTQTMIPEMKDTAVEPIAVEMVSMSCQTDDVVISVAPEPVNVDTQVLAEPAAPVKIPTVSVSTQTDVISEEDKSTQSSPVEEPQPTTVSSPTVPTIAIIPPGSEPATPRTSLVLPPHTKSIACQTEYDQSYDMRSVGMQTEAIQVDQRPVKLPASLLPSAILDKGDKVDAELISIPFMSPPPRSPHRPLNRTFDSKEKDKKAKTQPDLVQAYPGNNDNGPLAEDDTSDIRRPFRSSSLFAGFDTNDDELPEMLPELPDVFSDDEIFNRPMASYTLRSGRMVNRSGLSNDTLREEDEFDIDLPSTVQGGDNAGHKTLHSKGSAGKQPDIRRATLITNGAAAHQRNRPRSPSDPSIDSASTGAARPPFPVPVRLSSRNVPTTNSDSNHSPTPYSDGNSSRGRRSRRITRQPTLRKVRSATAMQKNQQERAGSRSPPPMSASGMSGMSNSSYAPDSPQLPPLPPMPTDEVAIYRPKRSARRIPPSRPGSIRSQAQSYSIEEPVSEHQSTNVVDAIAQTMVGEWMFKYVRRRKSFGMSDHKDTIDPGKSTEEVSASITSTGVRHKRWVWLAPYERAVMWSSKQPTSGPALLGKNGRKRESQTINVYLSILTDFSHYPIRA